MSTNQFKGKKFETLKAKWYKKLEKEGFSDIEQDENNLKQWDSFNFSGSKSSRFSIELYGSKETYYRLAGQFLHTHEFEAPIYKLIWTLHSEGRTNREISRKLKSSKYKFHSKDYVRLIVTKLSKVMLKAYGSNNK